MFDNQKIILCNPKPLPSPPRERAAVCQFQIGGAFITFVHSSSRRQGASHLGSDNTSGNSDGLDCFCHTIPKNTHLAHCCLAKVYTKEHTREHMQTDRRTLVCRDVNMFWSPLGRDWKKAEEEEEVIFFSVKGPSCLGDQNTAKNKLPSPSLAKPTPCLSSRCALVLRGTTEGLQKTPLQNPPDVQIYSESTRRRTDSEAAASR